MKLLINGKIKEQKKSEIDTGYFYGYGLFETFLVREGEPVLLDKHLTRLNAGLEAIGIRKTIMEKDITHAIGMLRAYNCSLKVNVSESQMVSTVREISYTADHYKLGARLKISQVLRNPTSPTVAMKTMNYMDNVMEMRKVKSEGWQDALFLNHKGEVCETAVANIFFIKDNKVITPTLASGLLPGTVREWLIENTSIEERAIDAQELEAMDAAFITNSLMGIMWVSAIGQTTYEDHPIIHELTQKYVHMLKG